MSETETSKKILITGSPSPGLPSSLLDGIQEAFRPVDLERELAEESAKYPYIPGVGKSMIMIPRNHGKNTMMKAFATPTERFIDSVREQPTNNRTSPKETKAQRKAKRQSKRRNRK